MPAYFQDFNYSLANEDTRVEQKDSLESRDILAICGSGARVIPLLHPALERITAVDTSGVQLDYLRLKRELIRRVDDHDYLRFLGYRHASASFRENILKQTGLDSRLRAIASSSEALESGLIFTGHWERKIQKMSRRIRSVLRVDFAEFFEAVTLAEQQELARRRWPRRRLDLLLKLFANRSSLNRQVYGGFLPEGENLPLSRHLSRNFEALIRHRVARESFFHQMLFLGELRFEEGFPLEARPEALKNFREFNGEFEFSNSDVLEALNRRTYEFLSLSDVPTFFGQKQTAALEAALSKQFRQGARTAVVRTFLRNIPLNVGHSVRHDVDPWQDSTGLYRITRLQGQGAPV